MRCETLDASFNLHGLIIRVSWFVNTVYITGGSKGAEDPHREDG